jgi:Leucine-rich repeat (LRR) protein
MLWSLSQVSALSADCQNVIGLAQSMKMTNAQLTTLKTANCCNVLGISCIGEKVTGLDWEALNLNGTVSTHLSKLTSLTELWIQNNNLVGSIPAFPRSIQYMSVENNHFTGKIPEFPNFYEAYLDNNEFSGKLPELPATAMYFYAGNNRLTGEIPKLPSNLQYLDVQSNSLSGGIPNMPPKMVDLILSNNNLKGKLPALPNTLATLNLASNAFFGEIPALPSTLLEMNLYNNDFTGSVPKLPTGIRVLNLYNNDLEGSLTIHQPVIFVANVNHFSSITVEDQGLMVECDISNNPIWVDTLASLEGNCRLYGTKKPRPANLGKRSIDEEDISIEKRQVANTMQMNDAQMLIMCILLGLISTIATML